MLTRLTVPRPATPDGNKALEAAELAVTQSNNLYGWFSAKGVSQDSRFHGLYQLDRTNRRWLRVPGEWADPGFGGLFGAEGNHLILRRGCCEYGWFEAPDVAPQAASP